MRFVDVTWADATTWLETGWKDVKTISELTPDIGSFRGWVIHEAKGHVVFATHRMGESGDESYDGELCLPRGCIISMVDVDDVSADDSSAVPSRRAKRGHNARNGKGLGPRKRNHPRA